MGKCQQKHHATDSITVVTKCDFFSFDFHSCKYFYYSLVIILNERFKTILFKNVGIKKTAKSSFDKFDWMSSDQYIGPQIEECTIEGRFRE